MASPSRQQPPNTHPLYHERQAFGRQLCAAHALNNLTQARPAVTAGAVAAVARELEAGGAQATRFFGNYDVNVLQAAASRIAGLELGYFDARKAKNSGELEALLLLGAGGGGDDAPTSSSSGGAVAGLVLNVPVPGWWGRLRGARHWLALLPVVEDGDEVAWWNLDSMLRAPERIGGAAGAAAFLRERLLRGGATLLVASRRMEGDEDRQKESDEDRQEPD